MKKYFLGLSAILIALSFCAFNNIQKVSKRGLDDLYWYRTNAAGTFITSSLGQKPKSEIEEDTECEDSDDEFCARGYLAPHAVNTTATVPSAEVLMETEPN